MLGLQKMGKSALLKEMLLLVVFPSHRSYHKSCTVRIARKRMRQIRPMGSSDLLQDAT
jgi:hypothetical protein